MDFSLGQHKFVLTKGPISLRSALNASFVMLEQNACAKPRQSASL